LLQCQFIFNAVKLPELYSDWRLVTGLVLIIMGAVNWGVGFIGTEQYRQPPSVASETQSEDISSVFDGLDDSSNRAVLTPLVDRQRKVSINSAQMDFFHAVFLVGQALFVAGLVITLATLLATFHRDAKNAMSRAFRANLSNGLGLQRREDAQR
jgi:hypothetical protein